MRPEPGEIGIGEWVPLRGGVERIRRVTVPSRDRRHAAQHTVGRVQRWGAPAGDAGVDRGLTDRINDRPSSAPQHDHVVAVVVERRGLQVGNRQYPGD